MNRLLAVLAIASCCITDSLAASTVSCHAENLPGYVAIDPIAPDAAQPFTIIVGISSYEPQSVNVQVQGNSIDVTLIANYIRTTPPPPACLTTVVGPLPAGTYTINLMLFDPGSPQSGTVLVMSPRIGVREHSTAISCPAENLPGYIAISPTVPDSTQTLTMTVGASGYDPKSTTVQVEGNVVNVTLIANLIRILAPPPACLTPSVGPLPAGSYTVNLLVFDPFSPQFGTQFLTSAAIEVTGPGPLSGLWWNSSESGWGIHFAQRRNVVFAAWYTYDSFGNPKWYVAPQCLLPTATATGSCTGTLYEVSGPAFFGTVFNSAATRFATVGALTLNFHDTSGGSMQYVVGGQTRTVPITRQPLALSAPPPIVDFTDLWWNPSESGWGLAITHQSNVMFLAWYVYDSIGNPVWFVASSCTVNSANNGCSGALYRTKGPAFGAKFDPSKVAVLVAGNVNLSFADGNNGTLSYTVDGVTSIKTITRQLF